MWTVKEVPDFFSGCFGMGSRDLQPGDIAAAVQNMMPDGEMKRHFYLGIDFIRKGSVHPKVKEWQDQVEKAYPGVGELALPDGTRVDLAGIGFSDLTLDFHVYSLFTLPAPSGQTDFGYVLFGNPTPGQASVFPGDNALDGQANTCQVRRSFRRGQCLLRRGVDGPIEEYSSFVMSLPQNAATAIVPA